MKNQYKIINMAEPADLTVYDDLYTGLEVDPYVKEGYRFKNIMRVRTDGDIVVKGSHEALCQSGEYNPVHGNMVRVYPEIPQPYQNELLHTAIKRYAGECGLTWDDEILVQAQRIKCTDTLEGLPSVEGPHRDGKKFVAIFMVARHNISGGYSQILVDEGKTVVFEHLLQPGEMLIVDDVNFYHYGSPIECVDDDLPGFRDIFIFSSPSSRASEVRY